MSALWVMEGLAFAAAGQAAILAAPPLLPVLVHLLRHGGREAQRASVRVLHNLTAAHAADGDLGAAPSLLPALLQVAGDPQATAAVRESAAWSLKVRLEEYTGSSFYADEPPPPSIVDSRTAFHC